MVNTLMRWGGLHCDNGGIYFDYSNKNIVLPQEHSSVFSVVVFDHVGITGAFSYTRQSICNINNGDSRMVGQREFLQNIMTTVYDTSDSTWKPVDVSVGDVSGKTIAVLSRIEENVEELIVWELPSMYKWENSRSDIGQLVDIDIDYITIGCGKTYSARYPLRGTMYALAIFKDYLDDETVDKLLNNWMCEECYRTIKGCVFAVIFDRLKYGSTPYDFINDKHASVVNPVSPPQWETVLVSDVVG